MPQLITQQDFKGEYPLISPNVNEAYFTPYIKTSQDKCGFILGNELYADLMLKFNQIKEATYINGLTFGVVDSSFYEIGGMCQVFISGYLTTDTTQKEVLSKLFENVFADISDIPNTTDITLSLPFLIDLSLYTITSLKIGKYLDVKYKAIYTLYLKPFLIYDVFANYIITSNLKSTNSGIMQHVIDTAQTPDPKLISMYSNSTKEQAENYKNQMLLFLENNALIYPLFNSQTNIKINYSSPIFLGANKSKYKQGYF